MSSAEPRMARIGPPSSAAAGATLPIFREDSILGTWINLGNKTYTDPFYPSEKGRLTPASKQFPCLYAANNHRTSVAEIWGDRFTLQRDAGVSDYEIRAKAAEPYEFRRVNVGPGRPRLQLCNLSDANTRLALGIESGTLYSPDIAITRVWAEMIATHRQEFDGIMYSSRLTGEECIVLWSSRRRPTLDGLVVEEDSPFLKSPHAYELAGTIGIKLAFV